MVFIKKVTMKGFKSYGPRKVAVTMSPGFTCIVGPNGSGKSNVVDALPRRVTQAKGTAASFGTVAP